jgi:hypothetical protein
MTKGSGIPGSEQEELSGLRYQADIARADLQDALADAAAAAGYARSWPQFAQRVARAAAGGMAEVARHRIAARVRSVPSRGFAAGIVASAGLALAALGAALLARRRLPGRRGGQ